MMLVVAAYAHALRAAALQQQAVMYIIEQKTVSQQNRCKIIALVMKLRCSFHALYATPFLGAVDRSMALLGVPPVYRAKTIEITK